MTLSQRIELLKDTLSRRILILDGAMGTMIQREGLAEADFRPQGHDPGRVMLGCNDVLTLTRPDVIERIHRMYIDAGADIIETCSFNANAISMAEYGLQSRVAEINRAAAAVARRAADSATRSVWVAGSMGPTGKSLTMAVNLGDDIDWDTMENAYYEQAHALIEGGVDLLLIETIFDTLNAKAALHAAMRAMDDTGITVPVITSVTLTESGRTLSGQSLYAFVTSVAHANPLAISLNCGFGPEAMAPFVESLADVPTAVAMYPNAGLPDKMGRYAQTPRSMADAVRPLIERRRLNIVGGCCGTTPDHIAALAAIAAGRPTRPIPRQHPVTTLAGLDRLTIEPGVNLVNIGERCNVAGSRKFLRLISEGSIDEAVVIAARQVADGAQAVDINMDDGMLDAQACMGAFVRRLQVEPDVARVPMVIDSSRFDVIMAGLKAVQGKPLVNSISLKEGEETFIARAREIHRMGAAMVVMAFDEAGQATTLDRRIGICTRAYRLLTEVAGIPPHDIVFDPNILTVGTGIADHDRYAIDFIEAVRAIKATLPGAKTGGGVSNLSFAFRGHNYLREAMHAVFLYHAVKAGLDTAIVNAGALIPVDDVPAQLREAIEDLLFARRPDATERLTEIAAGLKGQPAATAATDVTTQDDDPVERLGQMIVRGNTAGLEDTVNEAAARYDRMVDLIDGPLMAAMDRVGAMFGDGRMFLPQVVKSASVMKAAVAVLEPRLEAERRSDDASAAHRRRTIVLATVKGDVHDIGKNIVAIIMRCNGWDVVDLGVMVPADRIIEAAIEHHADAVGLSGLITPSLDEMCRVARLMDESGLAHVPLFIGGATTSALHTAVKIAPCRPEGLTVYTRDAASVPAAASRLVSPATAAAEARAIRTAQQNLRGDVEARDTAALMSLRDARSRRAPLNHDALGAYRPETGLREFDFTLSALAGMVNRKALLAAWSLDASDPAAPEARQLLDRADALLERLDSDGYRVHARVLTVAARSTDDDSILIDSHLSLPMLRTQIADSYGSTLSVSDFVRRDNDVISLFAVTAPEIDADSPDEFARLLSQSVSHRLAEAATELAHRMMSGDSGTGRTGIRPAIGYPMMPDQSMVHEFDRLLDYKTMGVKITANGALSPSGTTTGLIIYAPGARYFDIGAIGDDQLRDYAARRDMDVDAIRPFLARNLMLLR